jgi:hypothetical protein
LLIQQGIPASGGELIASAQKLGVRVGKASPFGFRALDRSSPVPVTKAGDSIVDAADGLRRRRRGEASLNGRVVTSQAKALIAKVTGQKPAA